jgi:hypothetical protein
MNTGRNMMNKEELDRLIEKYYKGETSFDEEALLRAFFSNDNIPEEYKTEKELFGYFMENARIQEPDSRLEQRIFNSFKNENFQRKNPKGSIVRMVPYMSIAAGILVIIALWFFTEKGNESIDTFDDPSLAYAETMRVLLDVSSRMNEGTKNLKPVVRFNEGVKSGSEILNKPAEMIRENLKSLNQFQKAFEITGIEVDNKKR